MLPTTPIAVAGGTERIREKASTSHAALGVLALIVVFAVPVIALTEEPSPYEASRLYRVSPRPALNRFDKLFWVAISRLWSQWKQAIIIVTPEAVVGIAFWRKTGVIGIRRVPQRASFSCVESSRKFKHTSQADRVLSERMACLAACSI